MVTTKKVATKKVAKKTEPAIKTVPSLAGTGRGYTPGTLTLAFGKKSIKLRVRAKFRGDILHVQIEWPNPIVSDWRPYGAILDISLPVKNNLSKVVVHAKE